MGKVQEPPYHIPPFGIKCLCIVTIKNERKCPHFGTLKNNSMSKCKNQNV